MQEKTESSNVKTPIEDLPYNSVLGQLNRRVSVGSSIVGPGYIPNNPGYNPWYPTPPGQNPVPAFPKPFQPTPGTPIVPVKVTVISAPDFLDEAVATMKARAALRDAGEEGERSMAKAVAIFNAWTGNSVSTEDGWRFMIALKQAREIQGLFHRDDYVDLAAYSGLLGEEKSRKS